MRTSDWLTVLAILLAPLIAVQVTEFIGRRKEERDRQIEVFRRLIATRGARLAPAHVDALNLIDVEFYKVRPVTDAWKAYLDNLNHGPDPATASALSRTNPALLSITDPLPTDLSTDEF